jgi:large subunit ribosomal protein L4
MTAQPKRVAKVIDASGQLTGEKKLPDEYFGGEINHAVVHQVMTAQLAAARAGTASTKRRAEVRGGGSKPWRQKGTGRARHGSIRSPQWTGGGSVFGPKPRSFTQRVPKRMRKAALRSALATKADDGRVWILDEWTEVKTKQAAAALKSAEIEGRVLLVLDPEHEHARAVDRAFRNLSGAAFSLYSSLSTYDVLVADAVLFTASAYEHYTHTDKESRKQAERAEELVIESEAASRRSKESTS